MGFITGEELCGIALSNWQGIYFATCGVPSLMLFSCQSAFSISVVSQHDGSHLHKNR